MQTQERQAVDRVRDEKERKEKRKQGSVCFYQLACQCFTAHFYPLLTLCWNAGVKKTFEQSFLLGNITSKQILMPSVPFRKPQTPKVNWFIFPLMPIYLMAFCNAMSVFWLGLKVRVENGCYGLESKSTGEYKKELKTSIQCGLQFHSLVYSVLYMVRMRVNYILTLKHKVREWNENVGNQK